MTLPHVFGSNMVLQRRKPLPVWGWAAAGEKVSVQLADGPPVTTTANDQGEWRVALPAREAGGPFAMKVTGNNEVTLDNVRVGEVWLCSGQSNMQMSVAGSLNAPEEIAAAQYPNIRLLSVPLVPQPL
ncbi:MAG: 9-O-acetylesterase, partial [Armatimonadetes bacterium CG17_big_fil_post_rev_8_21_14_2_50_66_6]